jgi:hypothetical protein
LTRRDQTHEPSVVRRDFAAFARRLRESYPHLAWVRVLERHQSGALHVHLGLSHYVPKDRLAALWGHGFVDVRKIRAGGGRESARAAARYLSKYVTKSAVAAPGEHRYEVRQGFQPRRVRLFARTVDELLDLAGQGDAGYRWESWRDPTWTGPPSIYAAF